MKKRTIKRKDNPGAIVNDSQLKCCNANLT